MGNPESSTGISKKQRGKPFPKGVSGNPSGRAKLPEDVKHVRELAKAYTEQAIAALASVMSEGGASAKVAAANALLERGWGKSEQVVEQKHSGVIGIETAQRPKMTREEWLASLVK